MNAPMIPILLERIEKLEQSNRRLKLGGLVLLVGLAAIGVMGQARPPLQTVEAQEFVVKDAGGVVRARLDTSPSAASLNLFHEGGRASLVVSGGRAQGAHLAVADAAGKVKGLLLLNQGTGGFAFYDRNGQTRALLGAVADDGSSTAIILDASGKPAWKAP